MSDGLPVVILEQSPPFGTIELAGRDRPEQGVKVAGKQRVVRTHYPGALTASVQYLGTEEEPIVLRGWFQDSFAALLGAGTPLDKVALLRAIMQRGARCRLIWGLSIIRTGRLARVEAEFHQADRIRYELTFEVDAPDEAPALRPVIVGTATQEALRAALATAAAAAKTAVTSVRTAKLVVGVIL